MRSKIKAAALVLCAAMLVSGCKKTPNNTLADSSTVSSQPAASSATESTSSEISSAEPVSSAVSEPPAESTASVASSKPAPVSKPEVKPAPAPAPVNPEDERLMQLDNTRRGYGQGNAKDSANRPTGAVAAQEKYEKYGAVFIAPPSNNVYLTFDLGYENGYTSKILDTLAEKNVKGIFFATMGYCKSAPQIVERIIKEGHILGNHSVSHKSMPTLSVSEMKKEIQGLHDYIKTKYGYEMFLFRPPMGEYSTRSLAVAQGLGYKTMNWSFAYKDWDTGNQPDEAWAQQKMLNDVHGGAIYLIHAVSKTNAAILGNVIEGIRAKGFEIAEYPRLS